MFCSNCGFQNGESATFCQQCGTRLNNSEPSNNQNISYNNTATAVKVKAPRSSHPVLRVVKDFGASPLYLTAIIAFTFAIFFTLISLFRRDSASIYAITGIMNRLGMSEFNSIIWQANSYLIVLGVVSLIPSVIYAVGMWLVFAAANQRNSNTMATTGLTMIKVMEIISLVFNCIIFAIAEIACIVGIISVLHINIYGYYDYQRPVMFAEYAVILLAMLSAAIVIGFVLAIIYQAKVISSINRVKKTIATANADYKVSGYVAIMNFILAFFSIFSLFNSNYFLALSTLCSITGLICFGILLFKYKNAMKMIFMFGDKVSSGFAQVYNGNTQP